MFKWPTFKSTKRIIALEERVDALEALVESINRCVQSPLGSLLYTEETQQNPITVQDVLDAATE